MTVERPSLAAMRFPTADQQEAALAEMLSVFIDADWYLARYPEVALAGIDPVLHFIRYGLSESRDPNPFFDSTWYLKHYPDVLASGVKPLLHYMSFGARELRSPHPRFDARYYVAEHPEAADNPLLYHLGIGKALGYATEPPFPIDDYLPSRLAPFPLPAGVTVDVIIPVYRGLAETRSCLASVLADPAPPLGRIIVVEDRSPEPALVAWLQALASDGRIILLRNRRNLGFVASVNRGMTEAGQNDVVLLNSDTEVPPGWLGRLAAQAYAAPRIASVSPFSNNATICGYPDDQGGPIAFNHTLAELDQVCRTANAGRCVEVPTTVGFCMYIRRDALREVGLFDAERFGDGYGEENDFCLRASAKGWAHRLACDTFVYHRGHVSFGERRRQLMARAMDLLTQRCPDYEPRIAQYIRRGRSTPYRFAITAALFRLSKLPVILMVSHDLGGGIRRHIDSLIERTAGKAHMLLLEGTPQAMALSVPALPHHPPFRVAADQIEHLETLLRSMAVSRVHIHHLMKIGLDVGVLIRRLGVPFDLTVHDYYAICPQRNLLPWEEGLYCREPAPPICNACIADAGDLVHGARDILSWRLEHAWQFLEADRVICPSDDVRRRLDTYGLAQRALVVPHENAPSGDWPVMFPDLRPRSALRVVLLGVLANLKGGRVVAAVAGAAPRSKVAFHLVGYADANFPDWARGLISRTGEYKEAELPDLIRRAEPHVFWFASTAPETYSYTLTAAIETGLPIVATKLGAFAERLRGRPLTWLVDDRASPEEILAVFEDVRRALSAPPVIPPTPRPDPAPDFYDHCYLQRARMSGRSPTQRPKVVVLAERQADGSIAQAGYMRLLQPMDHPSVARDYHLVLGEARTVMGQEADAIVLHPRAVPDRATAGAIIAHARSGGIRLAVDLHEPFATPDPVLEMLLAAANAVWVATPAARTEHPQAALLETRLDERLWLPTPAASQWDDPLRLVWFGSAAEAGDLAMIEPVLIALKHAYSVRIEINVLGLPPSAELPEGLTLVRPPAMALRAYPAFVHWLRQMAPNWHIGLAPMADTVANSARSPVRVLEYAALGIPVLASEVPTSRGSPADGAAGQLVPNTPAAWHASIDWLIRAQTARQALAAQARPSFEAGFTLASAGATWNAALGDLLAKRGPSAAVLRPSARDLHSSHELPGTASRTRGRRARG